nr:hypothetical protein [uncultured Massilia sp.]
MDMEALGIAERPGTIPGAPPEAPAPRAARKWRRMLDYIDTHLDADLRTPTLARACRLDVDRFTQSFSEAVGIPPHRYVAHKRLERARRRLLMS